MSDDVAEQWRRFWQKTKQNENKSDEKRQETAENPDIKQIATSIDRVGEQLRRQNDEPNTKRESVSGWKIAEVFGLWAAAAVGVTAVIVTNQDSSNQLGIMQGQLDEMHTTSTLAREQARGNVELDRFLSVAFPNGDWQVRARWQNHGPTNADEFKQWISWGFSIDDPPKFDFSVPTVVMELPQITLGGNAPIDGGPTTLPAANLEIVAAGNAQLYIWGDASYKDLFFPITPVHHTHFCSRVTFTDAKNPTAAAFNAYKPECNYAK